MSGLRPGDPRTVAPANSDLLNPGFFLARVRAGRILTPMDVTPRKRSLDPDRPLPWFSCAFCRNTAEKPFRICESCGESQPDEPEANEEGEA